MQIVYVARHDQANSNDDEGAITHALTSLGHTVERLREEMVHKVHRLDGDFVLFHHMKDLTLLSRTSLPKVFWCFDLIDFPDETIKPRCDRRKAWIKEATDVCTLGFCTDGDWVLQDKTGKLRWLMQGADVRMVGRGEAQNGYGPYNYQRVERELMFTGITRGGATRQSWCDAMFARYGPKFCQYIQGKHGRRMADLIAGTAINLAPDGPITNHYWSNRVYNVLGFGGFLLHPYTSNLYGHYEHGKELVLYRSRAELYDLIDHYLTYTDQAYRIGMAGLARTLKDHLYTNRVADMIRIVQEVLQ